MADMNIEEKVRENEENAVLQVKNLHTSFFTDSGEVKAVNGVSFNLGKGKILGVVGESGSGKSVTAYSIMQILADTGKVVEGEILFKGQNILDYSKKEMDAFRGKKVSIVFQDPMTSAGSSVRHFSFTQNTRPRNRQISVPSNFLRW